MQPTRLRTGLHRIATASLLAGWWGLLAWVIHACFLRPPPRSLELTLQSLLDPPAPGLTLALAGGSGLRIALGSRSLIDGASLTTALAWLALMLA